MIPLLIHQTFTYGTFVLSLITNAIFIWISTTTISDSIGRYRYLMIGFAVMDVLVSITHLILMPGIQLTSVGYIFFGYHLVDKPPIIGTWAGVLFVVFFYQTFIILAFHYIYRYAVVCEPRWRNIFTKHTTFWWSFISTVVQLLYTFGYYEVVQIGFMPSEYKAAHYHTVLVTNTGIDISKFDFGYLAIIFRKLNPSGGETWQMDAIVAIFGALSFFGLTAVVIVICSLLILRQLRISKSTLISTQMRKTQQALLKALIVQTVIPSIFSYIPLGMIFLVPFLGFNMTGMYGDLMIMSCAVFPAIDPIIMLYFVRSYRTRIAYIWRVLTNPNLTHVQQLNGSSTMSASPISESRRTN
ncbi:hypothetical protein PRIPAC_78033 [Pristionchus pacificus]|uniref:G protein-coupled receptor n=1 Tax=Pristionchus pacificus TaxID=54126 RepID=A0A2A6C1V8_PRIPA|nr:hypothetical protein PRIPAC_78033 [Pristionchus pacificus]|eukprot:PDM72098.1 G protein-coupled receptor [Pristionchus pacificus]